MKLADDQILYVRMYGKAVRVTAIFQNDDDANAFMARHPEQSVIACFGPLILIANAADLGIDVADHRPPANR
jgi:hypothetical protein